MAVYHTALPYFSSSHFLFSLHRVKVRWGLLARKLCSSGNYSSSFAGLKSVNFDLVDCQPGLELLGGGGFNPQFMSTDAHFWVKIVLKLQFLGRIWNISAAAPPPVLLGQFQHCCQLPALELISFRQNHGIDAYDHINVDSSWYSSLLLPCHLLVFYSTLYSADRSLVQGVTTLNGHCCKTYGSTRVYCRKYSMLPLQWHCSIM